ncbi:hypothetical protein GUA46_03945 [Muricauda sp. HICW]|uniref:Replication initiation factor n=1 Tax=Flagellimonas chongwuensis TaxID=2697365 RepID=A0A850NC07_9FLAO|nr:hypothetical protein [Allomuricauda chongwuensis]NVN17484.1 hypothetical protein [Allomuricauda chongwuensis]
MIDNLRFYLMDKDLFDYQIEKSGVIDLTSQYNRHTGEIEEYPKKGKYYNLSVDIYQYRSYVTGSFHKLFNNIVHGENHNYNDFRYCEFLQILEWAQDEIYVLPDKTSITNLEFGLNIEIPMDADIFLDYMLLMYDFKIATRNEVTSSKNFREFKKTDYSLKVYNKSKQNMKKTNVVRFEVKITKSRLLHKMGIYSLEDLKSRNVMIKLFELLLVQFDKLLIIDMKGMVKVPDKACAGLIKDFTNPNYWSNLKNSVSSKVFRRVVRDCRRYVEENELDSAQFAIRKLLQDKFEQMMNCYGEAIQKAA